MFDRVVFNKGVYTVEVVQMEEEKNYVLAVPWLRARGERAPLCATIQYLCEYVRSSTAKTNNNGRSSYRRRKLSLSIVSSFNDTQTHKSAQRKTERYITCNTEIIFGGLRGDFMEYMI